MSVNVNWGLNRGYLKIPLQDWNRAYHKVLFQFHIRLYSIFNLLRLQLETSKIDWISYFTHTHTHTRRRSIWHLSGCSSTLPRLQTSLLETNSSVTILFLCILKSAFPLPGIAEACTASILADFHWEAILCFFGSTKWLTLKICLSHMDKTSNVS